MPLYDFYCDCGYKTERVLGMYVPNPSCPNCGEELIRKIGTTVLVKIKGEGGFQSRRKWLKDWTPNSPKFGSTGSLHGEKY